MEFEYCKMEIFVPRSHFEALRAALQHMDAGHIGKYDSCLSYSEVTGCWRPLPGSDPYLGAENLLCSQPELKVEVLCKTQRVEETLRAIRAVHPYEVPVIHVIPLYKTGCP